MLWKLNSYRHTTLIFGARGRPENCGGACCKVNCLLHTFVVLFCHDASTCSVSPYFSFISATMQSGEAEVCVSRELVDSCCAARR